MAQLTDNDVLTLGLRPLNCYSAIFFSLVAFYVLHTIANVEAGIAFHLEVTALFLSWYCVTLAKNFTF